MAQKYTAFFENFYNKDAEESGGEPTGAAPLFPTAGLSGVAGLFSRFLERYNSHFHVRARPCFQERAKQYLSGLFQLECRRNIERIDSRAAEAEYQSLHHFVTHSPWDDKAVCAQITKEANQLLGGSPVSGLIIDPAGTAKKGTKSVGVTRQYCGNIGKVDNCQVGVFAALVKGRDTCLINKRLFLPKEWCEDKERCAAAGVPKDSQTYKNRAQLAMELIKDADDQGVDYAWIGMDAEFGSYPWFLRDLDDMKKRFLIDVRCNAYVYTRNPCLKLSPKKLGQKKLRFQRKAVKVQALRHAHGKRSWRRISIRDSSKGEMIAEFLQKKIWYWNGDQQTRPRLWHLLIRRTPKDNTTGWEYKYSLSNMPSKTQTKTLAYQQSQRFWVEQAIKDSKNGLGIDEYQVRKWRAWHHHVALTMLAGLFVLETRLEHRQDFPLLSITDVREILEFFLPKKVVSFDDLKAQIRKRHEQRWRSYIQARKKALGANIM